MPTMKNLTIDGTTFDVVDDQSVHFTEQTLTEIQKAQARGNIGAETDMWFEIADITTTEEVMSLYVGTDKNGNRFECKKIVAELIAPSALSGGPTEWIGVVEGLYGAPYFGNNIDNSATHRMYRLSIIKGMYVEMVASYNTSNTFWGDLDHCRVISSQSHCVTDYFKGFLLQRDAGYPVGTKLKVWGLRA